MGPKNMDCYIECPSYPMGLYRAPTVVRRSKREKEDSSEFNVEGDKYEAKSKKEWIVGDTLSNSQCFVIDPKRRESVKDSCPDSRFPPNACIAIV